ncbi:hypothetical protein MCOR07_007682 [Pyricularia oryzae]|uniref:Cytochrome P450 n=1 Tax=Pyricularia grisea TaxID=148305 RepID=A0ABQ8N6M5_PYRGI|nr:hypothetical protein MCOR33_010714 [Pyricularia grisea]KAI6313283.1 hypothetical protein MCOR30_010317 [Pyricularia oryzae]KAI6356217.1 hypothetical protein MCOR32_010024 [Pyricularia oryzae]KAI6396385.1 hypothetical protein MCOR20_009926 [Pyricularia oryzae]KAI6481881.1 hypothetical protein MCOR11_011213 [Pyricularia oryzae]
MTSIWSLSSALDHILAIFPDVTYLLSVLLVVILQICLKVSFAPARRPDLSNIPGPWYTRVSHMWFFYQRWHGRLAPASHAILLSHGDETNGIVRLSPTVVLLNDMPSLKTLFGKQDAATGTKIVRALNLGGHSWSIMAPEFDLARGRRQAVQAATTETNMRLWRGALEREVEVLLGALRSGGAVDVVRPLRMLTTKASALALAGTEISDATAHEVLEANGLFNRCVAKRLCMPDAILSMLDMLPWREHLLSHTSLFRTLGSGAKLFTLGEKLNDLAAAKGSNLQVQSSALYLQRKQMRIEDGVEDTDLLSADTAGGLLAGSETTAATLAWILFELSRRPELAERLRNELTAADGTTAGPDLLDAVIKEELRYRGPVALTSNRIVGAGGATVLGGRYFLPAGTVVVMHNHSLSRRDPRGSHHVWDPMRWVGAGVGGADAADRCTAPFGIGIRRCPGKTMAWMVMRKVVAAVVMGCVLQCPAETTDETMEAVELNGNRPRKEECRLMFFPRDKSQVA